MLAVVVADEVSNAGACSRLKQLANTLLKSVTLPVAYAGTLRRLLQLINMLLTVVIPENVISGAACRAVHPWNMLAALLLANEVEPVGKVTLSRALALANIELLMPLLAQLRILTCCR